MPGAKEELGKSMVEDAVRQTQNGERALVTTFNPNIPVLAHAKNAKQRPRLVPASILVSY